MYIITVDFWNRMGVLKKEEKYSSEDTKTKVLFVIGQWIYVFLMLIPVPLYFYFRYLLHTLKIENESIENESIK